MLALFQDAKAEGNEYCQTLSLLFPEVRGPAGQPSRTIRPPLTSIIPHVSPDREDDWQMTGFSESRSFNSLTNQSTLLVGRADIWWYYRGPVLETLPGNWAGTCALVQLSIPFIPAFRSPAHATHLEKGRDTDTDTAANHRGSFDSHAYIDAIGVPKGVSNEFKARNQIEVLLVVHYK
jgi:hypothetical protein